MGALWLQRIELVTTTSEIVGHKSGLALTRRQLGRFVPERQHDTWTGAGSTLLRVRSEEFEEIVDAILYGVGAIRKRNVFLPGIDLFHKYKGDPTLFPIFEGVAKLFVDFVKECAANAKPGQRIDPTPFVERARAGHGLQGVQIALEYIDDWVTFDTRNPWSAFRRVEWKDTLDLHDLFKSESLDASYGKFLDQRFIDYLDRNFGDIDRMNWRKFEGLTCEFFDRSGYHVVPGEGRNDGGIDARVWPRKEDVSLPATILVQCKRQKEKVGKVVVKALYADILDEGAQSGLVVTTSTLSPGAEKVRTARGYPIGRVERSGLRRWIEAMRTPGAGVFLGQ